MLMAWCLWSHVALYDCSPCSETHRVKALLIGGGSTRCCRGGLTEGVTGGVTGGSCTGYGAGCGGALA